MSMDNLSSTYQKDWISLSICLPPEAIVVDTKIDDAKGIRNIAPLKRHGRLYFYPDDSMYVYYTPTHWKSQ